MLTAILLALLAEPTIVEAPAPKRSWTNEELSIACIDHNLAACERLARRELTGRGKKQDRPAAAAMFEVLCGEGVATSCTQLGAMLLNGNGVPVDHAKAADVFRLACSGKQPSACASLGMMYARGLGGLRRDRENARMLYKEACEGGWTRACKMK